MGFNVKDIIDKLAMRLGEADALSPLSDVSEVGVKQTQPFYTRRQSYPRKTVIIISSFLVSVVSVTVSVLIVYVYTPIWFYFILSIMIVILVFIYYFFKKLMEFLKQEMYISELEEPIRAEIIVYRGSEETDKIRLRKIDTEIEDLFDNIY